MSGRGSYRSLTFMRLIFQDLASRRTRTGLTAVAVAISVMAIVTLSLVTKSLERSAAAVLQMGNADFIVAQKGAPDILSSVVTDTQVVGVSKTAGVQSAVGALIDTFRLDAAHPQFLQIGLAPGELAPFGVKIVAGRAYGATATNEIMLGWQAAQDIHKSVGDSLKVGATSYRIVGLYSLAQVSGDTASMFPLIPLQASEHKPGTVTLVAVQVRAGASIDQVRKRIAEANPNLATVRLASEFGRVDRNLEFLKAAQSGATIIALLIGIIIVMNSMLLSLIERMREFGVLRALGWSRRRLVSLVIGEAVGISVIGAALGVGLAVLLTFSLEHGSSLQGYLQPQYSGWTFGMALYSAIGIGVVASLYPSLRAGMLRPGDALRKE
ncbi:MAG: ABC transporter permease [Actinomycetota bacterium]|nr:ABC transporter permease [Actinomycetota bacterium]